MRVNKGLLRLYGEVETGRLLGAEMIGPAAEHLAHLLAWSLQSGATVSELLARPYYHPCIEESLRTALRDLEKALGVSNRADTTEPGLRTWVVMLVNLTLADNGREM